MGGVRHEEWTMKKVTIRLACSMICMVAAYSTARAEGVHDETPRDEAGVNEQARGVEVASALNRRFNDHYTVQCDGGTPAYACSGIVIRGTSWSPAYRFWNLADRDDGYVGVSFSYLRKDLGTRAVARNQGFILKPASHWGQGGMLPLRMLCSFAFDAFTGRNRGETGCGAHVNYPIASVPCAEQGIETVAAFAAHYAQPTSPQGRFQHQCAFGVDWRSFHLSILARQGGSLEPSPWNKYSEQVIERWPPDVPERLPLEALFFVPEAFDPVDALSQARGMQGDYFSATGLTLPILRFHDDPAMPVFTYHAEDQSTAP
jgi:hypothetical protein